MVGVWQIIQAFVSEKERVC